MSLPNQFPVQYHCDSGLGIIHFADGRGNRLNPQNILLLKKAVDEGIGDVKAKILMLRSGEQSFCLGMDLQGLESSLTSADSAANSQRLEGVRLYSELLRCITTTSKPIIALVEGEVKAGGVGLAAACDIVIGTEVATFELSEVLFGLVPYNVLPYVFELRMSPQRFRYLVLSAIRLDAWSSAQFGLIDQIYPVVELEKKLKSFLKTMMRAEPQALAAVKDFFTQSFDHTFDQRREMAEATLIKLMEQPQIQQGLEAFNAGSTPPWFQRFRPTAQLSGSEQ